MRDDRGLPSVSDQAEKLASLGSSPPWHRSVLQEVQRTVDCLLFDITTLLGRVLGQVRQPFQGNHPEDSKTTLGDIYICTSQTKEILTRKTKSGRISHHRAEGRDDRACPLKDRQARPCRPRKCSREEGGRDRKMRERKPRPQTSRRPRHGADRGMICLFMRLKQTSSSAAMAELLIDGLKKEPISECI